MKTLPRLWIGIALVAAVAGVVLRAVPGAKVTSTSSAIPVPLNQPAAAAGWKVHVDPLTGRIAPLPAKAAPDAKVPIPSSHEGLVEEPGKTAAGGFKVDARGKFRSSVILRAGPDGKPLMACVENTTAQ
jgi:hypothetical protein